MVNLPPLLPPTQTPPPPPPPPSWVESLFPQLPSEEHPHPEKDALCSRLRAFATETKITTYVEKSLQHWRVAFLLSKHNKALLAAQNSTKAHAQAFSAQTSIAHFEEIIQNPNAHTPEAVTDARNHLQTQIPLFKAHAAITKCYAEIMQTHLITAQTAVDLISTEDRCAQLHIDAFYQLPSEEICSIAYKKEILAKAHTLHEQVERMTVTPNPLEAKTENFLTQAQNQARQATTARKHLTKASNRAIRAFKDHQPELCQNHLKIMKAHKKAIKAHTHAAQSYTSALNAHLQASLVPTPENTKAAKSSEKAAFAAQKKADALQLKIRKMTFALAHPNETPVIEQGDDLLHKTLHRLEFVKTTTSRKAYTLSRQASSHLSQKAEPLTKKAPFKSTIKERTFQRLTAATHRIAWLVSRAVCFFFTAPFSLLDATFHGFWCATKFSLFLLRHTVSFLSGNLVSFTDTFLEKQGSMEHVLYHAKKTAYFTLNMFFGPFVGLVSPDTLLTLQTNYSLTADLP